MKKFLAILLLLSTMCTVLMSCDLFDIGGAAESETDLPAEETDGETEKKSTSTRYVSKADREKNELGDKESDTAKLVGFRTQASLYDGEFNSKVGWKAAGMGYIIKTKSGKLIAVDGGNTEDASSFYNLLKEYSETETVVVDYWILTHPHGDHCNALIGINNNALITNNLTVKNLVYYFPAEFKDKNGGTCEYYIQTMESVASDLNANIITPKKDQKITLDDVTLEFLYTPTDYAELNNTNQLSLIFTVKAAKKKAMITGDAFVPSLTKVANEYRDSLKCDILQMPHHFLCDTGHKPFYDFVGAEMVLLPTCISGYAAMVDPDGEYAGNARNKINIEAMTNAKYVYKAYDGNFVINM